MKRESNSRIATKLNLMMGVKDVIYSRVHDIWIFNPIIESVELSAFVLYSCKLHNRYINY